MELLFVMVHDMIRRRRGRRDSYELLVTDEVQHRYVSRSNVLLNKYG